jgi:hypothetical protein
MSLNNSNDKINERDLIDIYSSCEYDPEKANNNLANTNYYYKTNSYKTSRPGIFTNQEGIESGTSLKAPADKNLSTIIDLNVTNSSNENNTSNVLACLNLASHFEYENRSETKKNANNKVQKSKIFNTPYDENLLSSTLNQIDKELVCHQKSYFDKLPPDIEISVYGSETLPENSVFEADYTVINTSGNETDTSTMNNLTIRNKKMIKLRYFMGFRKRGFMGRGEQHLKTTNLFS